MSRFLDARPPWRTILILTLALAVTASGAAAAANTQAARQKPEARDPDERAAGGELPESGNEDGAHAGATLLLTPSTLAATPGSRIRLTLSILGADDLRRLPVTIRFDPAIVAVASVALGSAWDNRQRPVLLHDASRPGELVIGLGQLAREATGVSGSVELLELEMIALAAGETTLVLDRFAAIGGGSRPQPTLALTASIVVR